MDVTDRDDRESELARKLGRFLQSKMGQLIEALGDPPRVENIPAGFWDEAGVELTGILRPFIQSTFLAQAQAMLETVPVGVDWALVNQAAMTWATSYTFELVKGINETSRTNLQAAVSRYFESGQTIGELRESLAGAFGPVRAEMIASTEITRAAVNGERELAREVAEQGIQMQHIYQTNKDELVCPICGPMQGQIVADESEFPPLHPRCRCWINTEFVRGRD